MQAAQNDSKIDQNDRFSFFCNGTIGDWNYGIEMASWDPYK